MRWYWIALLVCVVIGPFDALYVYIRSQKRREALKRRNREAREAQERQKTEDSVHGGKEE